MLRESAAARLCLLTRAAWQEGMPAPLTRASVRRMIESGALQGLVLRDNGQFDGDLLQRARLLLSRVKDVYVLLQEYEQRGYVLLLPQDAEWPLKLRVLGAQQPLFLFAKGNLNLLKGNLLSAAGGREIGAQTYALACKAGACAADAGYTLVHGGARGVDSAAGKGAADHGGSVVFVPAQPAQQVVSRNESLFKQGRGLALCDTLPDDPFSAQRALVRNHLIYALGCAAVVIAPRLGVGGTWHGAADCLQGGWTTVSLLREDIEGKPAHSALLRKGARMISLEDIADRRLYEQRQMDMLTTMDG